MPIRFRCQDCRSRVKVPEGTQGKQVKCPRCGRIQSVPRHHSHNGNVQPEADGLTVHTLVGSMHKAPKRKEALVGAGGNGFDRFESHDSGAPGGLDIATDPENGYSNNHRQHDRISRKQRRRMEAAARQAEQAREEATAQEVEEREQQDIDESRRRVADLFATSREKSFEEGSPVSETGAPTPEAAKILTPPKAIAFGGNGAAAKQEHAPTPAVKQTAPVPARAIKTESPEDFETEEPESRWTFDLTSDAYPFLRVIPWVLRITALMLIGPAFKVMLVADAQGFSGVVSLLVLFMGLSLVVVTWTVGEIATAVRDIALRKLPG